MGDLYPRKPSHRALAVKPSAKVSKAAPAELSYDEADQVAQRREAFLALMPDALPFFQDLYKEGLIDGWRAIQWVHLHGQGISADQATGYPEISGSTSHPDRL